MPNLYGGRRRLNSAEIQEQVNKVIAYSQDIENPKIDKLIADWLAAKRDFIEAMGGEPIFEWPDPVSLELGPKEKLLRIDDFINMVDNRWRNGDLANFVEANRSGFFSNQVIEEYPYNGIVIPKGMKLLKAFKFFEEDSKALNDIQSAASMIIQEDKIEGTLCLSVHPLDYLSSSENTHNWRSCHSLDGEYKSGNLSYMVDRTTVVCYLRSKKKEKLPNFPEDVLWNSKKWRVLLFFSEDWEMMFAGRQYPFSTETGLDFVKEKLLPAARLTSAEWSPWIKKKIKSFDDNGLHTNFYSPYIFTGSSLVPLNKVVINEPGALMFNDLLSSSCYDPVYAVDGYDSEYSGFRCNWKGNDIPKIRVGGAVKCCRCGCNDIELSETFMCNDCEIQYGNCDSDVFATCPCCGSRFYYDDGVYVNGADEIICPDCAEEYLVTCMNCGELVYKEDAVYERNYEDWACKWCHEDIFELERK